ncbi:hypothetical protein AVEN_216629-1 [Araneus ventricosus]|uniref:Integrase catalytic domain-containing protein n=1 Tax=Araneus ventricosus TaxID=182803 RepID=A0A4Y2DTL8_ARAVE|nr:hypothetical protein AVEN_216629-1 [Araneus ventricosus]
MGNAVEPAITHPSFVLKSKGCLSSLFIVSPFIKDRNRLTLNKTSISEAILHSDQGTNFNSAHCTELCKLLGILKTRTTALHPESDGMVERFNQTILNHLSLFVSKNHADWDTHLSLFLLAYRSADHEVTGFTPADMLFGRTL